MSDTVDPIGIVGAGRVAQTLGRLLSENGRPVAAISDTVAEAVTSRLKIPTIGIGAGPHCDGQTKRGSSERTSYIVRSVEECDLRVTKGEAMLSGKNPLRGEDLLEVRDQAKRGPFETSRRNLIVGGAVMVTAFGLVKESLSYQANPGGGPAPDGNNQGETDMNMITTKDGTKIYFKDWGTGSTVVFSHGWPLNADAWDAQMLFLGQKGYRVIAHDRRGHGRSSQPWTGYNNDTFADDLATLIETLDLKNVTLVAHSMGGGEIARYVGRHGTKRLAKMVFIGAVPPLMLKTEKNPGGLPLSVFDGLRSGIAGNRAQFYKDVSAPFFGYNKPDAKVSAGVQEEFWRLGMQSSIIGSYECVKAFSEDDFTEDLKKIDVPTLFIHGEADQIVPVNDASVLAAKLVKGAKLKLIPGAPHGLCTTHSDLINADLLAFLRV